MKHLFTLLCAILCTGAYAQVTSTQHTDHILTTPGHQQMVEKHKTKSLQKLLKNKGVTKEYIAEKFGNKPLFKKHGKTVSVPLQKGSLKLQSVSPIEDDQARITLNIESDWGDGSGYQLLLDPDGIIYFLPESGQIKQIYSEADYKIPEDATPLENFLVAGQSMSIDVPDGIYDFLLFNPTPSSGSTYIPGGMSEGDDIHFKGGYEYVFTVTSDRNSDNCDVDCDSPTDLSVTAIKSPKTNLDLTASEDVTISITNVGETEVPKFDASYTINRETSVTEQVNTPIAPGQTIDYTFKKTADLSNASDYTIKATVESEEDGMTLNDSKTTTVSHTTPITPPYDCTFEDADDPDEWDIIDANGDGITWDVVYYGEGIGFGMLTFNEMMPSDDYIIMHNPISLKAGDNHIVVIYNGFDSGYNEKMALYYGQTNDVSKMTKLYTFENFTATDEGFITPIDFTIPEDGNYYFAFHGYSDANQGGILLNEVIIDSGKYIGTPDLSVDNLKLPFSGCSLGSDEPISVTLSNKGTADIKGFTLECKINDTVVSTEKYDIPIKIGDNVTVELKAKGDFSEVGTYNVAVTAKNIIPADGQNTETILENNRAEGTIHHFTPTDVPFTSNFEDEEQRGWWFSDNSWTFDDFYYAYCCEGTTPLISRGINLKADKTYNIAYHYMAGQQFFYLTYDQYDILYGEDGTDVSIWTVLYQSKDEYTNDRFADNTVQLKVPKDGVYSVAFRQKQPNGLFILKTVDITEATGYDISIGSISQLPTQLPEDQLSDMTILVPVSNNGSNTVSGKVTLSINDKEAGVGTFTDLNGTSTVNVEVPVSKDAITSGPLAMEVVATIDDHEDANPSNNTTKTESSIQISKDILAYDHVDYDDLSSYTQQSVGTDQGQIVIGVPIHLYQPASLTGVSLGWGDAQEKTFDIYVFDYDPTEPEGEDYDRHLSECLFTAQGNKPAGSIPTEYTFDQPLVLQPGDYMLGIGYRGYGLAVDCVNPGSLFALAPDTEGTWFCYDQAPSGFGTAALRAILNSVPTGINSTKSAKEVNTDIRFDGKTLYVSTTSNEITGVDIYSTTGLMVSSATMSSSVYTYPTSQLPAGVYIVKVTTNNNVVTKTFAVQ